MNLFIGICGIIITISAIAAGVFLKIENQKAIEAAQADATVKTTQAQADADAAVIKAQGQADANKLLNDSLTDMILKQQTIDKWNGELPKVSGTSNTMVDVGDVVTN